jgi:enoyl-CoA hydratase/carnithine racemase
MTDTSDWPDLRVSIGGAVAEVRLSRPRARNALSISLMEQLTQAAEGFRRSTKVHAVILTGGKSCFTAGADLADPARQARALTRLEQRQAARLGPDMCAAWEGLEQVTIAAVEGYCIGGGVALAAALDFRIAGAGTWFRLPEIALGMNMSWGALPRLATLVGPSRAKQLAIFCEACTADEALRWGLIDVLTPTGGALAIARQWAAKVAALPPIPVRMTKQAVNGVAGALHNAASFMDRDQWMLTAGTGDFREGAQAFAEKRKPVFRGD